MPVLLAPRRHAEGGRLPLRADATAITDFI
jgi:hypothetical protein